MVKQTKTYEHANDLHVVATHVYAKSGDTKAYVDEAFTEQFTTSALKEVFVKGALVVTADGMYHPTGIKIASDIATLSYVTVSSTTATGATLVSKADEVVE